MRRDSLSPHVIFWPCSVCVCAQAANGISAEARRAARYFLYRKYVYISEGGPIGTGVRIRIPPCVVERIRHRLREPGCERECRCALGGPLYRCSKYVGHRDAP